MTERVLFDKSAAKSVARRAEWVTTRMGDVWVREMTGMEAAEVFSRSRRPPVDPRGGIDLADANLYLIAYCCYVSDEEGAARLFDPGDMSDLGIIVGLPFSDYTLLVSACNRVCGRDASEVEELRGFSAATSVETN